MADLHTKSQSEFGKGLCICLVKFAEHVGGFEAAVKTYERMNKKSPGMFTESDAIHMWANGASDHLYDIEVPEGKQWDEIRESVRELQDLGLLMGHSFTDEGKKASTQENFFRLSNLAREIAIFIDKQIGLEPEIGEY